MIFGIKMKDGKREFGDFKKQDAANVTTKKQDLGSPKSKMYNKNLVVTVLDEKINLQVRCLYR